MVSGKQTVNKDWLFTASSNTMGEGSKRGEEIKQNCRTRIRANFFAQCRM